MNRGQPTLVLTNDDGMGAPGLVALERAVRELEIGPYCVIAPSGPYSGCGHQVTTHAPIGFVRVDEMHYSVSGTPADCVRLALHMLAPGVRLVLSGINAGGNLGTDVFHSGTVAAVREGALNGVAGIALSHYMARGRAVDWDVAALRAGRAISELLKRPWNRGTLWNVNLPHPESDLEEPDLIFCPVDPSPLPLDFRVEGESARYSGDYQKRARIDGGDVSACFGGAVAISSVGVIDPALIAERSPPIALRDLLGMPNDRKPPGFTLADTRSIVP